MCVSPCSMLHLNTPFGPNWMLFIALLFIRYSYQNGNGDNNSIYRLPTTEDMYIYAFHRRRIKVTHTCIEVSVAFLLHFAWAVSFSSYKCMPKQDFPWILHVQNEREYKNHRERMRGRGKRRAARHRAHREVQFAKLWMVVGARLVASCRWVFSSSSWSLSTSIYMLHLLCILIFVCSVCCLFQPLQFSCHRMHVLLFHSRYIYILSCSRYELSSSSLHYKRHKRQKKKKKKMKPSPDVNGVPCVHTYVYI